MIQSRAETWWISWVLIAGGVLGAQDAKPLPASASPGKSVQDSAQAAIRTLQRDRPRAGAVDILSDTQGVDFGPYLQKVLSDVRSNWYKAIPASVQSKKGSLAIEFAIQPDGRIANIRLTATSGDTLLDRAALGGIIGTAPFSPLPAEFTRPFLALRLRFYYNPDKVEPIVRAVLAKSIEDSGLPKYPDKARKDKIEGMVRLDAHIAPDGTVESVTTVEGSLLLGEAASSAVRNWTFQPARRDGKPVDDRVRINIEFFLNGEQVRAQVISPAVNPDP
jgi:TonB family protein